MAGQAAVERLVVGVGHVHEPDAVGAELRDALVNVVARERDVLDALALIRREVLLDLRLVVPGFVDRDADLAARADDGPAPEAGELALDVEKALLAEVEQPLVELRPLVHAAAVDVVGQMVDAGEPGVAGPGAVLDGHEVDVVDGALAVTVDQVDETAADALDRRNIELHRPDMAMEGLRPQLLGPLIRGGPVLDPERHRTDAGPVLLGEGPREAVWLGGDDVIDAALLKECYVFRAVTGHGLETHLAEQRAQCPGVGGGVLDELEAVRPHGIGGLATRL